MRLGYLLQQKLPRETMCGLEIVSSNYTNHQLGHIMSPVLGKAYRTKTEINYGKELLGLQLANVEELYSEGIGDSILMLVFPNEIYPALVDWAVTERLLGTELSSEKTIVDSLGNCLLTNPLLLEALKVQSSIIGEQNVDRLLYHAYSGILGLVTDGWLDVTLRGESPLDWQKVFINLLGGDNELSKPESISAMFFVSTLYKLHLLNLRIFNGIRYELRYVPSKIVNDTLTAKRVCDWFHETKVTTESDISVFIKWLSIT